jgi:hypothetical protein
MLKVFITVDTEVWPQAENWPHVPLGSHDACRRELDCYFWGGEKEPKLGLPFQLDVLRRRGLSATFFVDPLFSFALGLPALRNVVGTIQEWGQEVGLHLHPEWLTDPRVAGLPKFAGPLMSDYSEAMQSDLIMAGLGRLKEAGSQPVISFRAGSWGANMATLRALARTDIRFDSSLNAVYATSMADFPGRDALLQPRSLEGIWEVPPTYFIDKAPDSRRPLQVCACSLAEFKHVLEMAYARGWDSVVVVSHSFELVRVNRLSRKNATVGPQRLLGARFEAFCDYLACHRDRFKTMTFRDASSGTFDTRDVAPIASNRLRTLARMASQALSLGY